MEDRIEINGVWYVKETTEPKPTNKFKDFKYKPFIQESDCSLTKTLTFEDDDHLIEIDVLLRINTGEPVMPGIKITEKDSDATEYWDNDSFLKGLIDVKQEDIEMALKQDEESEIVMNYLVLNKIINVLKIADSKGMFGDKTSF